MSFVERIKLTDGTEVASVNTSNQLEVAVGQWGGTSVVNGGTAGTIAVGGIQAHDAPLSGNNPILVGGVGSSVTPTAVTNGDLSRFWLTTTGALNIADAGASITVDGTVTTVGDVSHDGVDSGNPQKIGAKAIAHSSNPAAVAAADRTDLYANRHGILWTIGGHPNIQSAEYFTTGAQTNDNVLPLISAGTKYVITSITVTASAANTVNTSVRLGFGTTGVPAQGTSGADAVTKVVLSHPNIPAGSGVVKGNGSGIVGIGGDGEELYITCSAPTTGSLIVQVDYYTIES